MTFSQEVKSEILKSARKLQGANAASFLTAVLKSAGSLTLVNGGFAFTLESDNLEFLTLCKNLAFEQLNAEVSILTREQHAKSEREHTCTFEASVGKGLGLISDEDGTLTLSDVAALIPTEQNAKRGFMQGLFVAGGSVVIPKPDEADQYSSNTLNTNYHLELRFTDDAFATAVAENFPELDLHFLSRKSHSVLYVKDSEKIADFLVYVNATKAKFALEDVIISRSMRNKINRQKNCDIANINKTVNAAGKQLEAIATLKKMGLFDDLPDPLKDIALLREKYHEATLDEIADMLSISKSGASHRFAKLIELSQRKS
ncbi:MAG: DNA-binding protein WhiA [Clostridiales bacterium]|nr:DNA-binding protein WhiA [Clostridiales bacterium]